MHFAALAEKLGPRDFIALLHLGQTLLNLRPPFRSPGNKLFCIITKGEVQPCIEVRDCQYDLKKETVIRLEPRADAS